MPAASCGHCPRSFILMGLDKRLTEGVTKRHGFHRDVVLRDESGCTPARGFLQKRARAGHWHRRFFKLNNVYLVYAKTALGALDDDDAVAHADEAAQHSRAAHRHHRDAFYDVAPVACALKKTPQHLCSR